MSKIPIAQNTFSSGEWAPSLYARTDLSKYSSACKLLLNWILHPHGGASTRPGTYYVAATKTGTKISVLIPFQFSVTQNYVLEFGDLYMRVIKDYDYVYETGTITGITKANPGVVTCTAHPFAAGDVIYITGVAGMTQLNGNYYKVGASPGVNDFHLHTLADANLDTSGYTTYTSGGTATSPYEIVTPYAEADLQRLKVGFSQTADTMFLCHPTYQMRTLVRVAESNWTLATVSVGATQTAPTLVTCAISTGTSNAYVVTAVSAEGEESVPSAEALADAATTFGDTLIWRTPSGASFHRIYRDSLNATGFYGFVADIALKTNEGVAKAITGISKANPGVVTCATHGFAAGDFIYITGAGGMIEVNNAYYRVGATPGTNDFHLHNVTTDANVDTTAFTTYTSGGTVEKCGSWVTQNITPDLESMPPVALDPFAGAGNYPGCCAFYEQRFVTARPNNAPDTIFGSQIGRYKNFNTSHEIRDDDSWEFTLNSQKMNEIIWLLPLESLLIGSAGEEWKMNSGSQADTITNTSVSAKKQSAYGSATMPPLVVGNVVLFLQYGARVIREMSYSLEQDAYIGRDLTILATHLFRNRTVIDWCYQRNPDSTIWCVRDDGVLLGLTYLREQEVWGWHRHTTDGQYESVCTIPDGAGNDRLYAVVCRTINGETVRHIECFAERDVSEIKDAWFVDDGISYGWGATECHAISGISKANPCVVTTVTHHGFTDGDYVDIDDVVGMTEVNTHRYRVDATGDHTFHLHDEEGNANVNSSAYTTYVSGGYVRKCATTFSGANHLEGKTVSVLANGSVVAGLTVTAGAITLPTRASRIIVGLPHTCDMETLSLVAQGPNMTTADRIRRIVSAMVSLENTRALWIGPDESNLVELQLRTNEACGDPTRLFTGEKTITLKPGAQFGSRIFARVTEPLPATVLSFIARLEVGGEA
jgi:hypothetical protein